MTNEIKAMFWTMGFIAAVALVIVLTIVTEGWFLLALIGALVVYYIYWATLGFIKGDWR